MRATVSFDIGIGRVADTMRCLVLEEAHLLNGAIEVLESITSETLAKDLDAVLERLSDATQQLQQYKAMLISFERAKFETMLPQPATATAMQPEEPATAPPMVNELLGAAQQAADSSGVDLGVFVKNMRDVQEAMKSMGKFDSFIDRINHPPATAPTEQEECEDVVSPTEG